MKRKRRETSQKFTHPPAVGVVENLQQLLVLLSRWKRDQAQIAAREKQKLLKASRESLHDKLQSQVQSRDIEQWKSATSGISFDFRGAKGWIDVNEIGEVCTTRLNSHKNRHLCFLLSSLKMCLPLLRETKALAQKHGFCVRASVRRSEGATKEASEISLKGWTVQDTDVLVPKFRKTKEMQPLSTVDLIYCLRNR